MSNGKHPKNRNIFKTLFFINIIIVLLLLYGTFNLFSKYEELETKNLLLESKNIDNLNTITNLENQNQNLKEQIEILKEQLRQKNTQYNSLQNDFDDIELTIDNTISKISDYEEEIDDSMEWFSTNSILGNSKEELEVYNQLEKNCFEADLHSCKIKLGCLPYINIRKLGIDYIEDTETSYTEDKLQSITDFLKNEGGDCEDYSLFYKSQFNSILNECEGKKLYMDSWNNDNTFSTYYVRMDEEWFIDHVAVFDFEGNFYPNVICGDIYDLNTDEINGHCMIAFSEKIINSIDDLSYLNNAIIIEPQSGEYIGRLNDNKIGIYLLENGESSADYDESIWAVITDNDYYLFSEELKEWRSYQTLNKELNSLKETLGNLY